MTITKNIPEFPNFRPFTIEDVSWYKNFYLDNKLNPYVDIHPENLFIWLNINNNLSISNLGKAIILRYSNILNHNKVNIIPLENPIRDHTIEEIMQLLQANNLPPEIGEIPSVICNELDNNKWLIKDDRDSYEYILNTNQQSLLEGSDFSRQRRRINFFDREHTNDNIDIQYYREINPEIKEMFLHHIETMPFNSNEESTQQNISEPIAIRKNLEYASIFHKKILIIKINDKVASLAMISYLDDNTAAINHIKVDYSIQYIFQYTIYQLAKLLEIDNIKEMNLEQDLGIEGLRVFKERLQPSRLLEKKHISIS